MRNRNPTVANPSQLLYCQRLTRREQGQLLLSEVDFSIEAGTSTAVVGPSGAGKTVLLRAMAMLDPLTSGSVSWRGTRLSSSDIPEFRSRCVYLHQKPYFGEGTVRSVLQTPFAWSVHRAKSFDASVASELLDGFGRPPGFLDKSTADLSGGEAQLVSMTRALMLKPTVLLLDEPTSALDAETEHRVEDCLGRWRNNDRALVVVSHKASQVDRIADRVISLKKGRVAGISHR